MHSLLVDQTCHITDKLIYPKNILLLFLPPNSHTKMESKNFMCEAGLYWY